VPKIIVIGHLLLKLLYKMWSHVFLGHGVEPKLVFYYWFHRLTATTQSCSSLP